MLAHRRMALARHHVEHVAEQVFHPRKGRRGATCARHDPAQGQRPCQVFSAVQIARGKAPRPVLDPLSADRQKLQQDGSKRGINPQLRGQIPIAGRAEHRHHLAHSGGRHGTGRFSNGAHIAKNRIGPTAEAGLLDPVLQDDREIVSEPINRSRRLDHHMDRHSGADRGDLGHIGDRPAADRDDAIGAPHPLSRQSQDRLVGMKNIGAIVHLDSADVVAA